MRSGAIVVLDVGKTMSKLSLWTKSGVLIDRDARPNQRRTYQGSDCLDVDGITPWIIETLRSFAALAEVEHLIPVAHGAGFAVVRDEHLVAPPMDYEAVIPGAISETYAIDRDAFAISGSPRLAEGLNAAIQLYWQEKKEPGLFEGATIMPWAQYWGWYLSGQARSEVTSLGCHTDLWAPNERDFSPFAKRMGWSEKMAPIAFAGDVIGHLRADLAKATGLPLEAKIHCGLHDSNAALVAARAFPEIADHDATVLSTGTWFIAMRSPKGGVDTSALAAERDCLINVDAWGNAVPSARFMGGREIETLIGLDTRRVDIKPDQPKLLAAVPEVLSNESMLSPTFARGFGPFPDQRGRWINMPEDWFGRRAGACLYSALVADVCLDLVGSRQTILVEGRFAEAEVIVRALAALRPQDRIYTSHAHNDVSFGALRLINPDLKPEGQLQLVEPLDLDLNPYREIWRDLVNEAAYS